MSPQTMLYLYFDAQERLINGRIIDITNRCLRSGSDLTYDDIVELLQLTVKLDLLHKVELDLNALLFYN